MQFMTHQAALYNAIRESAFREYWAYGAIRSGKTVPIGAAFTRKMIREPGNYFATNSSAGNVWAVQWPLIRAFAARAGVKAKRVRGGDAPSIQVGDSQAWVVGLKNAGSHDNYMGRTTRGGWYEEVNKCNQESFDMLLGRGSLAGAQHLMAMNPDGPRHWTAEYIANVAERNGWSQQTRLTDNTKLDPAYVEYLKSIYTLPHLKRRYIDGEFAAGEGLVYQFVPSVSECSKRGRLAVVADAGASSVTAALYGWEQTDGTWIVADEYYYDARARPQLGDAEHAAAILRRHPQTPDVVLADGANLRYEFTKLGAYARTPIKDFEETIGHLDSSFRRHALAFQAGTCPNTRAELDTLEWDSKARERGEDVPVDGNDHGADCVRYLARAVVPKYTAMIESANIF